MMNCFTKKKRSSLCLLAAGLLTGAALVSSCSVDLEPSKGNSANMLADTPVVAAYSGDHYWGTANGTRAAQPNANQWGTNDDNGKYKDYPKPDDITPDELEKVLAVFNEKGKEHYEPLVDWHNFFVQQVYCGPEGPKMTELATVVDYKVEIVVTNWWPYEADTIYRKVDPFYDIVNNFNNGAYSGNTEQGCMLMFDSSTLDWSFKSTQGGGERFANWRMEYIDGAYYIGFDFQSNKQGSDANENEYFERDYIYNDWIIKIVPGIGVDVLPPAGEQDPEDGPADQPCDKDDCEHEAHGDNGCKTCYEEGRSNQCATMYHEWLLGQIGGGDDNEENPDPKPGEGDDSGTPGENRPMTIDEVEVNLAMDQKKDDLLESHLSIHVRSVTDVEVFIPVPAQYYCKADDMDIVLNHTAGNFVHGGPYETEFKVGENVVTLTVAFEADGIRITTDGITQEVIDYCWNEYQDGITFEIWNYFNDPDTGLPYLTMSELKNYLDQATVSFLDKVPGKYVNAFGRDNGKYDNEATPDGKDFHVVPDEEYSSSFEEPYDGYHNNGSDNNEIYDRKKA